MDGSQGEFEFGAAPLALRPEGARKPRSGAVEPSAVRQFLADNPDFLKEDAGLLAELGLAVATTNIVEFAPVARVHAAHQREAEQRALIEEIARANFSAHAQTHGAVVDLLDARNHSDLARRLDDLARTRFGLAAGVIALETDGLPPAGWTHLVEGQVDLILDGPQRLARVGFAPTALGLFDRQVEIRSMAMVRLSIWEPARRGLLAFGSADPEGFTPEMGSDLVAFLARVVERTAERWPFL
jgi:uncharacterized protein YigA (DUF484 family)